jgi:hypothetical protein
MIYAVYAGSKATADADLARRGPRCWADDIVGFALTGIWLCAADRVFNSHSAAASVDTAVALFRLLLIVVVVTRIARAHFFVSSSDECGRFGQCACGWMLIHVGWLSFKAS